MYKLHLLQHLDWYRTGTSYCYFYIFEIIHHHSVIFKIIPSFVYHHYSVPTILQVVTRICF